MNNFHKMFIVVYLSIVSYSHADNQRGISHEKTQSKGHLTETIVLSQGDLEYSLFELTARRILTEAYARIGKSVAFETFPLARSLVIANDGVTDGELVRIGGLQTKYSNLIQIPISIVNEEIFVYSKKYTFNVEGWLSLKPYKIDYIHGFKLAEEKTKGMDTEKVRTVEQGLRKLDVGRSDLFLGSVGFQCLIKKLNLHEIKILNPPVDNVVLFHYLHKRHKDMAEKLEGVLIQMKESGEIESIQEQSKQDYLSQCK